ncbi:hypothetical protein GCM10010994_31550 [Chelatococcus reniformis]|uniref:Uncharacterized protein n=1 Tax=Chelatococcus reniformis TaxID=1494448 RepID=A0A916UG89_9HYPH|nr:hypothetical protein GCM10010994_31550 [Chelatococcus reniformis]
MLKVAAGGAQADLEVQRMFAEKAAAYTEAQVAMAQSAMLGRPDRMPAVGLKAYSKRVRSNRSRLSPRSK